jgi:hypothetical protein
MIDDWKWDSKEQVLKVNRTKLILDEPSAIWKEVVG